MRHCTSCGAQLPKRSGPGRPLEHCDTERCALIFYSAHHRKRCARCGDRIPDTRTAQRAAICGACFVDLTTLAGLDAT